MTSLRAHSGSSGVSDSWPVTRAHSRRRRNSVSNRLLPLVQVCAILLRGLLTLELNNCCTVIDQPSLFDGKLTLDSCCSDPSSPISPMSPQSPPTPVSPQEVKEYK